MANIFISYCSADRHVAVEVRNRLRGAGLGTVFLDADPDDGLTPGSSWERQLYHQLGRTDAVVFLASPASAASQWCHSELVLARATNKPVIPLRIGAGTGPHEHPLLADVQWLDHTDPSALVTALRRHGVTADGDATWDGSESPFPGLEAFQESRAGVFFGRDKESQELYDLLHPVRTLDGHRFVTVVGPSGSGKSSLVRAGLLPRLRRRPERWLVAPPIIPRGRPTRELVRSLGRAFEGPLEAHQRSLLDRVAGGDADALGDLACELADTHAAARGLPEPPTSLLVVVDQAEELVTGTSPEEQTRFLDLLGAALGASGMLWVVATIRSDFLTTVLQHPPLTPLLGPTVPVGALPKQRLFEVIERPARRAGLQFAPGLVGRLVEETEGGDALPLLAFTLQQLAEQARDGVVTDKVHRAVGGVLGALHLQADRVRAGLEASGHGAAVLPALLRLANVDATGHITGRRVGLGGLPESERVVLQSFTQARLLTGDTDPETGEATAQVSHEAMLRQWQPLRVDIEARVDDLRRRAEVERAAHDWARSGRRDSYLLHGERLLAIRRWADRRAEFLADVPLAREFLDRSVQVDHLALTTSADALAARALDAVARDPELGLRLARTAVEDLLPTPTAQRALLTALASCRTSAVLRGHTDSVGAATVSPDGTYAATSSRDGTARIWDLSTGAEVRVLAHDGWVEAVAWSPDGTRLATGAQGGGVRIWDPATGALVAVLDGHRDSVRAVAFAPGGGALASGGRDGSVRVSELGTGAARWTLSVHPDRVNGIAWSPDGQRLVLASVEGAAGIRDARTGELVHPLSGHGDWVEAVAWSPDGRRVLTGSRDRTARVWDAGSAERLDVLRGHDDWVEGVSWSPDGRRILTSSEDRTARVWDAERGTELMVLRGHGDWVRGAAWTPDGRAVVTTSADRTARVWDLATGAGPTVLSGHHDTVEGVAWAPDGERVATASQDGTARVWHGGRVRHVLRGHTGAVLGVAWAPDGRLATASADRTARIWDADGREVRQLLGHRNRLTSVAWSPDGTRLVTGSSDHTARVWDAGSGEETCVLPGERHGVEDVAWSPDGRTVATASADRTVRLWDPRDGSARGVLAGHEHWVMAVAWSPDGARLASGAGDRTVRVWEAGGAAVAVLHGHEDWVDDVVWTPDGAGLVSVSRDGTVRAWTLDPPGSTVIGVHTGWVRCVDASPDGTRIVTGSTDRLAQVWASTIDLDAALARAAARTFDASGDPR